MRMRTTGLLIAPAALCLLANVLGAGISILFVGSPSKEDAEAGGVGLAASGVLLLVGSLSLVTAIVATQRPDRTQVWRSFGRWAVVAAVMVIPSGLLFGPTGGFHHLIGFGPIPFFYMVWNGEDAAPGSFQIVQGYEVWFNPVRFGVLLAIWVAVFAVAVGVVGPTRLRRG